MCTMYLQIPRKTVVYNNNNKCKNKGDTSNNRSDWDYFKDF